MKISFSLFFFYGTFSLFSVYTLQVLRLIMISKLAEFFVQFCQKLRQSFFRCASRNQVLRPLRRDWPSKFANALALAIRSLLSLLCRQTIRHWARKQNLELCIHHRYRQIQILTFLSRGFSIRDFDIQTRETLNDT